MASKEIAATGAADVGHRTLVSITDKLTAAIAQSPLIVAEKCFAKHLISRGLLSLVQLSSIGDAEKASQLVLTIITCVQSFPEKYDVFVKILQESPWLESLVKLIQKTYYEELKGQGLLEKEVGFKLLNKQMRSLWAWNQQLYIAVLVVE